MDSESNPEEESVSDQEESGADQEECVAEVDDSKKPLPSNKVRIELSRNDVASADLSSGGAGALAEGPAAADQEECVAEVDDSKKPLPSNKVRIKLLRNDVASADLNSGGAGALAEGAPSAAEHHRGETILGGNHSRPDGGGKEGNIVTCNVCNQGFLSMKSLYGHMKCHSELGHNKKTGSEIADVADGGSVKDKRGRENKKKCTLNRVHDDDKDDGAPGLLMQLANQSKVNQIDDQDSRITSKLYKCTICDKSFTSPQALGGHSKNGHKKKKEERVNEDVVESQSVSPHVCRICEKAFPSGQALADHRRCDWKGPSSSTSPAGEVQLLSKKESLDFDLNQLPEDDDEDQVQ